MSSLVGMPLFWGILSSQLERRSSIAAFKNRFLAVLLENENVRGCARGVGSAASVP